MVAGSVQARAGLPAQSRGCGGEGSDGGVRGGAAGAADGRAVALPFQ